MPIVHHVKYIRALVVALFIFMAMHGTVAHAVNNDSDGDGYTDDEEMFLGTDPNDTDTDDDNVTDYQEALLLTDPLEYDTITDDAYASDYELDNDVDGLSNGYELNDGVLGDEQVGNFTGEGGNPNNADTDEDGLGDWFEATYAGTCVDITIDNSDHDDVLDPEEDCDSDGLNNTAEEAAGSSPLSTDTDGDGYVDSDEVTAGSDPSDSSVTPDTLDDEEPAPEEDAPSDGGDSENPEEEPTPDEDISEDVTVVSAVGQTNGQIAIIYSDESSLVVEAFSSNGTPTVKLTPSNEYIVAVGTSGRRMKIFDASGALVAQKRLHQRVQQRAKLKVWDNNSDGTTEIATVSLRKNNLRTRVLTLDSDGTLTLTHKKRYLPYTYENYKVRRRDEWLRILHAGTLIKKYQVF